MLPGCCPIFIVVGVVVVGNVGASWGCHCERQPRGREGDKGCGGGKQLAIVFYSRCSGLGDGLRCASTQILRHGHGRVFFCLFLPEFLSTLSLMYVGEGDWGNRPV